MKLIVATGVREEYEDVLKRIGRADIILSFDEFRYPAINIIDKCVGNIGDIKKEYGYKIISYEEFIKDRIYSIKDVERLFNSKRLEYFMVKNGKYTGRMMPIYGVNIRKQWIEFEYAKAIAFEDINIEETQKLIIKEKDEMAIIENIDNVICITKDNTNIILELLKEIENPTVLYNISHQIMLESVILQNKQKAQAISKLLQIKGTM